MCNVRICIFSSVWLLSGKTLMPVVAVVYISYDFGKAIGSKV